MSKMANIMAKDFTTGGERHSLAAVEQQKISTLKTQKPKDIWSKWSRTPCVCFTVSTSLNLDLCLIQMFVCLFVLIFIPVLLILFVAPACSFLTIFPSTFLHYLMAETLLHR